MNINNHYELNELNELKKSLGDTIYNLLDSGSQGYSIFLKSSEEISKLLNKVNIREEEVFIERGLAKGLTIKEALKNASESYYFKDRLDEEI